jgi:membrane protease YdiL (CAAX protease family)
MRGGTFDVVMGIVGLGVAFLLFQVLITPVLLLLQIGIGGEGLSPEVMGDPARLMATYTRELIVSNGVGQLLGLALPALLLTRLHTSRIDGYLRLRGASVQLLVLAVVGVVGLQPVVQWLAQVNQQLPLPESMQAFEQTQMELIRSVLESGLGLPFNLLMLSLIPGLCEELLFRGYAQRQFERGAGPVGGILLSGVLFGVYHLRLSQVLPLVLLGCYLAYLTWRTGSLWPAVLVHMAHNALAVGAARAARTHPAYDLQELEQVAIPWYALLGGLVIVGAVLYVLHPLARRIRDG